MPAEFGSPKLNRSALRRCASSPRGSSQNVWQLQVRVEEVAGLYAARPAEIPAPSMFTPSSIGGPGALNPLLPGDERAALVSRE